MQVTVNGETCELDRGRSILDLLGLLEIVQDRVAVEMDRAIVKREQWATTELRDGAKLEIVQFVGGG